MKIETSNTINKIDITKDVNSKFAVIVGVRGSGENKEYAVVTITNGINGSYGKGVLKEENIGVLSRFKGINYKFENGTIKGYPASLDRLSKSAFVLISEICMDGNVLGYRLMDIRKLKICKVKKDRLTEQLDKINVEIPIQNMMYVSDKSENGGYLKHYPNANVLCEVLQSAVNRVEKTQGNEDINRKKVEDVFSPEQLKIIKSARHHNLDYKKLMVPELSADVMSLAYAEMACKCRIDYFAKPVYNSAQAFQLICGYKSGVDISKYSNPKLSSTEMSEIRERLDKELWKDGETIELTDEMLK